MLGEVVTGQAMKAAAEAVEGKPALVEVETVNRRVRAEVTGAGRNSVELESLSVEADGVPPEDLGQVIKAIEPAAGPLREIERQSDGTRVIRTPEPDIYADEIEYAEVIVEQADRDGRPVSRVTLRRLHRDDEGTVRAVPFPVTKRDMARVIDGIGRTLDPPEPSGPVQGGLTRNPLPFIIEE